MDTKFSVRMTNSSYSINGSYIVSTGDAQWKCVTQQSRCLHTHTNTLTHPFERLVSFFFFIFIFHSRAFSSHTFLCAHLFEIYFHKFSVARHSRSTTKKSREIVEFLAFFISFLKLFSSTRFDDILCFVSYSQNRILMLGIWNEKETFLFFLVA